MPLFQHLRENVLKREKHIARPDFNFTYFIIVYYCKGLAANQTGEILSRSPHVMAGYYNNAEATKETLTDDGWLRTGDIGHMDENGLFVVSDRMKELIKVNANQVPPAELVSKF